MMMCFRGFTRSRSQLKGGTLIGKDRSDTIEVSCEDWDESSIVFGESVL